MADSVARLTETLGNSIGYGFGTRWMVLFLLSSFSELGCVVLQPTYKSQYYYRLFVQAYYIDVGIVGRLKA